MKICAVQGMMAMILCSLCMAHDNYGQILERKVSLSLNQSSLRTALTQLEAQANVRFFYNHQHIDLDALVSIEAQEKSLKEILELLLTPHNIHFTVHEKENQIALRRKSAPRSTGKEKSVRKITGRITDEASAKPLSGVNILIKGTSSGTTSDADGIFNLTADEKDILVFSYIGYATVEAQVSNRTIIDITMHSDVININEVVINAGYWKVTEKEQTGSIARVTAEVISKQPVNNPLQALQGRMPGVYIQQMTGIPGGQINIQIRGQNSLRNTTADNGNLPLYIIDGVPFTSSSLSSSYTSGITMGGSPMNNINPADIESIEVLKDADATAIYGSRGANGVILITTKKGKAGKSKWETNFYQGASTVTQKMNLLNTQKYVAMRNEAFANDKTTAKPTDYDITQWDTTRYTNWQEKLIGGTASVTDAQTSFSGGSENTQFLLGGGFHNESTVFPGDFGNHKIAAHSSWSHHDADNKFSATFSANFAFQKNKLFAQDITSQAVMLPPNAPQVYDEYGNLNWEGGTFNNPYASLAKTNTEKSSTILANTLISYQLIPGLHVRTSLGYTQMDVKAVSNDPVSSYNPAQGITLATSIFANNSIRTWIVEPQAEYKKDVWRGKMTALIGATWQQNQREGTAIAAGFSGDAYMNNLQAATITAPYQATEIQYRYSAMFARLNYNLLDKYYLNLTARRDGSSRFGPGNQFANFGAVGAGWIFSSESFLENSFLSFGKIRSSYGITGSDQIGDYQYIDSYTPATFTYQATTVLYPTRLYNGNYSWETNKKFEAAMDLGFINDRIFFTSAFYRNRSSSQLVGYTLPATAGFSSVLMNFPATVQNTGVEFELRTINTTGHWKWTTGVNLTIPRNKLIQYPGLESSAYASTYQIGSPLTIKNVLNSTGVDPATGLYTYEDMNTDGRISLDADRRFLSRIQQQWYGGFLNTLRYNGFELEVFFQFVKQSGISYLNAFPRPGSMGNQPSVVLNRWQQTGDVTDVQRFTQDFANGYIAYANAQNSTSVYSDASFIRLKNLSLSYRLPATLLGKMHLQQLRIYGQGQNILTFTDYIGLDPENQNLLTLPPLKTFTLGIQITL